MEIDVRGQSLNEPKSWLYVESLICQWRGAARVVKDALVRGSLEARVSNNEKILLNTARLTIQSYTCPCKRQARGR